MGRSGDIEHQQVDVRRHDHDDIGERAHADGPDAETDRRDRATDDTNVLRFPSRGLRDRREAEPRPRLSDVVGDVLRAERHDQQRTLADVAERASVSMPYLSEVERGVKEVSSDLLAAICDALDLPLEELLERSARRVRGRGGSGITMRASMRAA